MASGGNRDLDRWMATIEDLSDMNIIAFKECGSKPHDFVQLADSGRLGDVLDKSPMNMATKDRVRRAVEMLREQPQYYKVHRWVIPFSDIEWCQMDHPYFHGSKQMVELGRGTFGAVFKAKCRGRDVAVKELIPSNDQDETTKAFVKEISLHFKLQYKHVVRCYGGSIMHGRLRLVMPLLHENLAALIASGAIPEGRKIRITLHVAKGLDYLHGEGVVHNDIKPANVMADASDVWMVMDFGLACCQKSILSSGFSTIKGGLKGTVGYVAPETYLDPQASPKPSKDVYAFGMLVFTLWTQTDPYAGMDASVIIDQVKDGNRPAMPSTLGDDVKGIIKRCWNQAADARPVMSNVVDMVKALNPLDHTKVVEEDQYQKDHAAHAETVDKAPHLEERSLSNKSERMLSLEARYKEAKNKKGKKDTDLLRKLKGEIGTLKKLEQEHFTFNEELQVAEEREDWDAYDELQEKIANVQKQMDYLTVKEKIAATGAGSDEHPSDASKVEESSEVLPQPPLKQAIQQAAESEKESQAAQLQTAVPVPVPAPAQNGPEDLLDLMSFDPIPVQQSQSVVADTKPSVISSEQPTKKKKSKKSSDKSDKKEKKKSKKKKEKSSGEGDGELLIF